MNGFWVIQNGGDLLRCPLSCPRTAVSKPGSFFYTDSSKEWAYNVGVSLPEAEIFAQMTAPIAGSEVCIVCGSPDKRGFMGLLHFLKQRRDAIRHRSPISLFFLGCNPNQQITKWRNRELELFDFSNLNEWLATVADRRVVFQKFWQRGLKKAAMLSMDEKLEGCNQRDRHWPTLWAVGSGSVHHSVQEDAAGRGDESRRLGDMNARLSQEVAQFKVPPSPSFSYESLFHTRSQPNSTVIFQYKYDLKSYIFFAFSPRFFLIRVVENRHPDLSPCLTFHFTMYFIFCLWYFIY